ncbi:MAG: hypothetical protein PGN07_07385 [Aeromicrobium erythreum]
MSRPADQPRRLLTDWTTTAGVAGDGLLALVVGPGTTAEGVHLATLGYEVFVLDAGDDLTHVHHVDVAPRDVPDAWYDRFALVVSFGGDDLPALVPVLAEGGLLVVLGDAGAPLDLSGLVEVTREQGPDPDEPAVERVRVVAVRVGRP